MVSFLNDQGRFLRQSPFSVIRKKPICASTTTSDYSLFAYALRSPVTREYYLRSLRRFFDFLELKEWCTLEERCNYFAKLDKNDPRTSYFLSKGSLQDTSEHNLAV